MADISQIKIGSTTYDTKDTSARALGEYNAQNGVKNHAKYSTMNKVDGTNWLSTELGTGNQSNPCVLPAGDYIFSMDFSITGATSQVQVLNTDGTTTNMPSFSAVASYSATYTLAKPIVSFGLYNSSTGQVVSNIMVRPKIITDSTFDSYALSNSSLTPIVEYNTKMGVKNLLNLTYSYEQEINDVTFYVNAIEGTITVNGTASANTFFDIQLNEGVTKYLYSNWEGKILTGAPVGASTSTYRLSVPIYNSSNTYIAEKYDYGSGVELSPVNNAYYSKLTIILYKDATVSNLVFKPMIREAFIKDSTFEPYAMSNSELTKLEKKAPERENWQAFDESSIRDVGESIISGDADTIAGKSGYCVVRTYYAWDHRIQIAEFADGTRKTRATEGSGSIWGTWV